MIYPGRTRKPTDLLSPQERLILSLAAQGLADKEIAKEIGISMGTVRTYWQRMRDKTNAKNRSEILSQSYERNHSEALGDLVKRRGRLAALIEGSSVGLALVDGFDEILEVNSAFAQTLDCQCSDLIGKTLREVKKTTGVDLSDANELELRVLFGGLAESRYPYRMQRQRITVEGELFHVLTLIPLTEETKISAGKTAFATLG